MARQPSRKDPELAEEVVDEIEELDDEEPGAEEEAGDELDDGLETRPAQAEALWSDVRIEPVEIALPKNVGYTLRAYRLSNEVTPTQIDEEDDDFAILRRHEEPADEDEVVILENAELFQDEPEEPTPTPAKKGRAAKKGAKDDDEADAESESAKPAETDEADAEDADVEKPEDAKDDEAEDEGDEEEKADEEPEPEEVPVFLGHQGRLFLFRSKEGLVDFVKSDAEHDLTQLDTWESLKSRITVSAVVPKPEDRYELDLVVENLRGGHDAWDTDLLIAAGELARDVAHAQRLEPVRTALAPGSPLDDLDEALRSGASGGIGGFFARRRLKKIGAQQAALGWRTIIGKISASVDWRD